jgi:NTP pyrophosphatase (non-canonical NTP hydrolase)
VRTPAYQWTIEDWQEAAHHLSRSKGWYGDPPVPLIDREGFKVRIDAERILSRIALIHSEVSEALEAVRTGDLDLRLGDGGKPEGAVVELADAMIRILDLCGALDLPLMEAMRVKHEYNSTRPHRHGGKLA